MLLATGLAVLHADSVAKPLVGRHRPFVSFSDVDVTAKPPPDLSFPSGHAASAFAAAFVMSRVFPELRVGLWVLAALVAFSRVYVRVHYPLDVLVGAVVGVAAAAFAAGGTRWNCGAGRKEFLDHQNLRSIDQKLRMVARDRIELSTLRFSVVCSTN